MYIYNIYINMYIYIHIYIYIYIYILYYIYIKFEIYTKSHVASLGIRNYTKDCFRCVWWIIEVNWGNRFLKD